MINLFQPNVTEDSIDLLDKVFKSNWLGRGDFVQNFEELLNEFLGSNSVHTIASASDGIDGVYDIFDFRKGDEILIPTNSFPIIASSAMLRGLKVTFLDVDEYSGNLSLDSLIENLSIKTKAVFVTHYGGIPVDIAAVRRIVGGDVLILEDSACALGTSVGGVSVGTNADFSVWSFDAMKLVVCGEGGAVSFGSEESMIRAKEYFYLGLPSKAKSGLDSAKENSIWWEYDLNRYGVRSIFTNVNAAIGIPQLKSIRARLLRKEVIASIYSSELREDFVLGRRNYLKNDIQYSNYFYTIRSRKRNELAKYLLENGVYSSLRYSPLHKMNLFSNSSQILKQSDSFFSKSLNIPIHSSLSDLELERIISLINKFD